MLLFSLAGALCAYFMYHMLEGERGIRAWFRLRSALVVAKSKLDSLEHHHRNIQRDIRLLGHEIDPDLLDQRVRDVLGSLHPDDVVVMDAMDE